jgi:hypothetical protein
MTHINGAKLITLRRHPPGCLRMARGQCGSLLFHRDGPRLADVVRVRYIFLPKARIDTVGPLFANTSGKSAQRRP